MAKIDIPLPASFNYSTEIEVLIQHINRANHLANEHLVALLNEARTRYFHQLDSRANNISFRDFINADLAVVYKSEAHYGDKLTIEIGVDEFGKYGCDFVYRVSQSDTQKLVAIAKTAMLHFDYDNNRLKPVPSDFPMLF